MRENTRFDAQFRPLSDTRAHSLRRRPIRIRQKYLLDGLLQVRKPEETTVRLTYHTKENFKKYYALKDSDESDSEEEEQETTTSQKEGEEEPALLKQGEEEEEESSSNESIEAGVRVS